MSQAQFTSNVDITMNGSAAGAPLPFSGEESPAFGVLPLTPFEHTPPGGYDQGWMLCGLMFDMMAYVSFSGATSPPTAAGFIGSASGVLFANAFGGVFVDDVQNNGNRQPVSLEGATSGLPYGPFVTTPPIADPALSPADDEVIPTRWLLRRYGYLQFGRKTTPVQGEDLHVVGHSSFRWAPRLRKRIVIGPRQELFLGFFSCFPFASIAGVFGVSVTLNIQGNMYYRLRR